MVEKEEFKIGDYNAQCRTSYYSPSDAVAECDLDKDGEFRAKFEFEVRKGRVLKADATLARPVFDELKPSDDESVKQARDYKDFMDKSGLDRIKLTVLKTKEELDRENAIWKESLEGW